MEDELNTTIRIAINTKLELEKYGKFHDNYNDIIQRILTEWKNLKTQRKPKTQTKPKSQKTQRKPKSQKKKRETDPDDISREEYK